MRCSSKPALVAGLLSAVGCVEQLPPIEGTTSLAIELVSPTSTGDVDNRLPDTSRTLELRATALDAQAEVDTAFSGQVDIHAHFLGSLTPELGEDPLATASITDGESGMITVELPRAFGPTFLWLEHATGDAPTYATGTTPTLWYRDPFLADVSRPEDELAPTALERSPLEEKEVSISSSRYGENGRLVVTGVYAQGYTVSDVECQDAAGTPPCTTGDYDHVFVFSFSRPSVEGGGIVELGQTMARISGAVQEFNGLTELGFPQSFGKDEAVDVDRVPEPFVIQASWLSTKIEMERVEEGLVAVDGATVCPLDSSFDTFGQWKLDLGNGCGGPDETIAVITKGTVAEFDPGAHVGQVLPRVVGTLRPVQTSGGSFNVWIIFPRDAADVALP